MSRRDGEVNVKDELKHIKFSELKTTGMILKEIERELIRQTVSNTGNLSDKVSLSHWTPWHCGTKPVKKSPKSKWRSINFLIERTTGKKQYDRVII